MARLSKIWFDKLRLIIPFAASDEGGLLAMVIIVPSSFPNTQEMKSCSCSPRNISLWIIWLFPVLTEVVYRCILFGCQSGINCVAYPASSFNANTESIALKKMQKKGLLPILFTISMYYQKFLETIKNTELCQISARIFAWWWPCSRFLRTKGTANLNEYTC